MGSHGQRAHGRGPMGDGLCGGAASHGNGKGAEGQGELRRGGLFIMFLMFLRRMLDVRHEAGPTMLITSTRAILGSDTRRHDIAGRNARESAALDVP